jgi:hypothetical protein
MHCLGRCALLVYAFMCIIDSLKRKDTAIKKYSLCLLKIDV